MKKAAKRLEQLLLYSASMNGRTTWFSFRGTICVGTLLLIAASMHGQNLFVGEWETDCIYEYAPDGTRTTFASGIVAPAGLAFDKVGNLFVTDHGSNVYEFKTDGTKSVFFSTSNNYGTFSLAFDSSGNLFEGNNGGFPSGNNIYKITTNGIGTLFATNISCVFGMAFDRAGDLFALNWFYGGEDIDEFTPDGTPSRFATGIGQAFGLAFDGAGNLYGGDQINGVIYEYAPDGTRRNFATNVFPNALAFNSAGELFEADGNGNIYKFTPSGVKSTFASSLGDPVPLAFQPVPGLKGVITNGTFQLTVSMPSPYFSTIVQFSPDLVNWVNVYTNTPPFTFTNSMATSSSQCFYRAVLGP